MIVKNILFILVLLYASYYDRKHRIIPDKVHVFILLLGLIHVSLVDALIGLIVVPLPVLIIAITKGGIGGGDIKLIGACSFFLGVVDGLYGTVLGILIAVLIHGFMLLIKKKKINETFAFAPYLSLGYGILLIDII